MKYDIILCTYNLSKKTIYCLSRIHKYTKHYRLIWIDNGSTQEEYEAVRGHIVKLKMPYVHYRAETNLGFVKGVNLGLSLATSEWRILINNDVYVTHDWLNHMVAIAARYKYSIVGPVTSPNAGQHQSVKNLVKEVRTNLPDWNGKTTDEYAKILRTTMQDDHTIINNGMIAFFCAVIHKRVIERIGYLSEAFGLGFGDDDDFCYRAQRNGFTIGLVFGTYVHHEHRSTFLANYDGPIIKAMQTKALATYKERRTNLK